MTHPLPQQNTYSHRLAPTPLAPVQIDASDPPIWCKLEFLNPSGSTKDRIARYILEKAWREGRIGPESTVVEASSGSTSIAMALACAQLGVRFIAVMPEGVSNERILIIRGYGGRIRFTPKDTGVRGAIAETQRMRQEDPGIFLPCQFSNPENSDAHRLGTAREILDQAPGGFVDAVVSGVGTGGTLVGLFQGLRDAGCPVAPVHARPVELSGSPDVECCSFSCRIPGVVDSISTIFRSEALPGLMTIEVDDSDAIDTTRQLIHRGFPVGPSSGLNYRAAVLAARALGSRAQVVTVFPDRMERYFTTELFRPMQCASD
ncbi:MAG: cysteine synthase family protein [Bryobacterales bacterium]|nr:cysteine synthase family protein [Bryobacterales bacterium]